MIKKTLAKLLKLTRLEKEASFPEIKGISREEKSERTSCGICGRTIVIDLYSDTDKLKNPYDNGKTLKHPMCGDPLYTPRARENPKDYANRLEQFYNNFFEE